jgi:hypothetical protein
MLSLCSVQRELEEVEVVQGEVESPVEVDVVAHRQPTVTVHLVRLRLSQLPPARTRGEVQRLLRSMRRPLPLHPEDGVTRQQKVHLQLQLLPEGGVTNRQSNLLQLRSRQPQPPDGETSPLHQRPPLGR